MNSYLKQSRWWPMLAVVAYLGTVALFAQSPAWWIARGILRTGAGVVTNDYSPINQGQLKWLATQAAAEFDEGLQFIGGAGTGITALVASFSTNNNYRPVNAGQLKHTVAPFYERLFALNLTNCYPLAADVPYPWSGSTQTVNDFALVNAGQAKYVFSFDLASLATNATVDTDGDGLPDWWELRYFGSITGADPNADPDGDGVDNRTAYLQGRNPLAGSVPDTNNQLALIVYTPLLNE